MTYNKIYKILSFEKTKLITTKLLCPQNNNNNNYYYYYYYIYTFTCNVKKHVGQIKQTIWKQQCGTCIQIWGFAISLTMSEAKIDTFI
jgi:hypothetical protein